MVLEGISELALMEGTMRQWFLALFLLQASGCAVVNQGEVGLRRVWGKIDPKPIGPGLVFYEAVSTDIIRVPVRTSRVTVDFVLPSKEGLNIQTRIAILYRIVPEHAAAVMGTIGEDYEDTMIASVFRSAAADVSARFFAKDMYSAERSKIEKEIATAMSNMLEKRGFIIEAVLMKSISLPAGLAQAIEEKLQAEQEAERMRFLIEREKLEAERRRIEATAIRDAQKILADGLTPEVIQLRSIEAFKALADSPSTKVIVTDGKAPFLIGGEVTPPAPAPQRAPNAKANLDHR
jgi:prohibitin 1